MNDAVRAIIDDLRSTDKTVQNTAFFAFIDITETPVDWAYEVWDSFVADLTHKDNHYRAISAQALCNLAKSDPDQRILTDFPKLLEVTQDERFVTARHCLQALWKVGIVGKAQQALYLDGLTRRYHECITEKNATLIRSDIVQSLKNVYEVVKDEAIRERAQALIDLEADLKYRKKYASIWKK